MSVIFSSICWIDDTLMDRTIGQQRISLCLYMLRLVAFIEIPCAVCLKLYSAHVCFSLRNEMDLGQSRVIWTLLIPQQVTTSAAPLVIIDKVDVFTGV